MLKNYLKVACRQILKNNTFFIVSTLGLAVGLGSFLLILQYVNHETSYDNFHLHADHIYRVRTELYESGQLTNAWATACAGLAPALKAQFPEVVDYSRLVQRDGIVSVNNINLREDNLIFAEPSFLDMFSFPLLKGYRQAALKNPNTAVISQSAAKKYFADEDPVGKVLKVKVDVTGDYVITGVIQDAPANSHLKYDILLSYQTLINSIEGPQADNTLIGFHYYVYVLLEKNAEVSGFDQKMDDLYLKLAGDIPGLADTYQNTYLKFHLQPLRDIHLNSHYLLELQPNGSAKNVYFLLIAAGLILLVASINYAILSTAKAMVRLKEMGMRKILGASRKQLIDQFLLESMLLGLIAILLSLLFIGICLPFFNGLSGMSLDLSLSGRPLFILQVLLLFAISVCLSGIFPAYIMTGISPVSSIRGKIRRFSGKLILRKGLVAFQFMISVILIAGTFLIYQQMAHLKDQDLGFDIENTLIIRGPKKINSPEYRKVFPPFKNEILKYPEVKNICISNNIPGMKIFSSAKMMHDQGSDKDSAFLYGVFIDYDFIPLYKVELVAGRNFSVEFNDVAAAAILTETAARLLGFPDPDDAIGREIFYLGANLKLKIVGVTRDYCQTALTRTQDPIFFMCVPHLRDYYSIKLGSAPPAKTIARIKESWDAFFPGDPFAYFFLEDYFNRQYQGELQFGQTFGAFALLSIILSSLGIFGLSFSSVKRRSKEVAIRKAVGATAANILSLFYKDYAKLIVLANIIGWPLIYWIMENWLNNFATRVHIGLLPFILAAVIVFGISLLTVTHHVVKVARSNPVLSLRYE